MPLVFEQSQPMAPGISEGAGALSQYERDRQFAMQQRAQQAHEQQQAFQQQLDVGKFQQSQVQPFQLQQQHVELQIQAQAAELTMAERLRMQRLQQGMAWLDQNGPSEHGGNDLLTQEEVNAHRMQLQTGLNPMIQRQQEAARLHSEAETANLEFQRSRLTRMDEDDRTFRSRSLNDRIIRRPNPMAGVWAQTFPNAPPLPDLEYVEQPNGTFLPMNDAANQAAIGAGVQLHGAQAANQGADLRVSPAARLQALGQAHQRWSDELRLLERDQAAAAGPAATDAQRRDAAAAITRHRDNFATFMEQARQQAELWLGGGEAAAGGGAPAQPARPAFAPQQAAGQPATPARQAWEGRVRDDWSAAVQAIPRIAAGNQERFNSLNNDLTRVMVAIRDFGNIDNMPAAQRQGTRDALTRLRGAGINPG